MTTTAPEPTLTLPTEPTKPSGKLEDKTILLYGPPKIGKSTLASEFPGALFLDTEGGLGDLEVLRVPVGNWLTFLEACAAIAADKSGRYQTVVIDTVDMLSSYCSQFTNQRLGIVHESEAEYGKGWAIKTAEFTRPLAKLATVPGLGLILISHAKDVEVKTRSRTLTKAMPTLGGGARDAVLNMADLILFCDFEETGEGAERRVIRTKPSAHWEAGERGRSPRLPDTIDWPVGHGYEALKTAWYQPAPKAKETK